MILDYWSRKSARRAEIRKKCPERGRFFKDLRTDGSLTSLWVALVFCALASAILQLRQEVVEYRPGQYVPNDVVARVDFAFHDEGRLQEAKRKAREGQLRIYRSTGDSWGDIEQFLQSLPDRVANSKLTDLPPEFQQVLDGGSLASLQEYQAPPRRARYDDWVRQYMAAVRKLDLVVIPAEQRREDLGKQILIGHDGHSRRAETTFAPEMTEELAAKLDQPAKESFPLALQNKMVLFTLQQLNPTHDLDEPATTEARNRAEERIPSAEGDVHLNANSKIVRAGEIKYNDYLLLKAENEAFLQSLGGRLTLSRLGTVGAVIVLTVLLSAYIARYQPRVMRNHARALGIAVLMLSMLLLAQLAGLGSSPMYIFGLAPTILVAMILAIAYDQRFATGVAAIEAALVTLALDQGLGFFLILISGVVTCCFLLDDIRTRSKLIEVGGATALAMIAATIAVGLMHFDPMQYIARNSLYAGAAGLGVGFVVLGILPFIEKSFRITTSMTLLELADASHPLLRRLSLEAPGTYNHSLQVATLAEEAAEAIGANSLLCRVASYYHDVGKINKAEYFIENQHDGQNRHMHLSPSVSILIIIGHVKDGLELAREYNLPTSIFPFIQQHHGTTLVEFFYHRAVNEQGQRDPTAPAISESQYRYPGPKPKSREIAIVMLADAVESACRAMPEPTASRIEALVHELAMRRLLDGQFDECDLTMRELELIERSLAKTLLGIYHGRIAYPSTAATTGTRAVLQPGAARTA